MHMLGLLVSLFTSFLYAQEEMKKGEIIWVKTSEHTIPIDIKKDTTIAGVKEHVAHLAEVAISQQALYALYKSSWSLWLGFYKSPELSNDTLVKQIMHEYNTEYLELSVITSLGEAKA